MDNELRNIIYGVIAFGAIAIVAVMFLGFYAESVSLECTKAALEKSLTTVEIMVLCK